MRRSARFAVGWTAVALTTIACSTSDSTSGGGAGGGNTSDGGPGAAETDDGGGSDAAASSKRDAGGASTGGNAPCKSGDQQACDACISAASKKCSASMCREEDLALENCSVMSVYVPCEDKYGNPSIDCCQFEQQMLIRCWNQCPDIIACG